jgi:hypothetical protein
MVETSASEAVVVTTFEATVAASNAASAVGPLPLALPVTGMVGGGGGTKPGGRRSVGITGNVVGKTLVTLAKNPPF